MEQPVNNCQVMADMLKPSNKKFYLGKIYSEIGDKEFTETVKFSLNADTKANEWFDNVVSGWYNNAELMEGEDDVYEVDDCQFCSHGTQEIDETTYKALGIIPMIMGE